MTDRREHHGPLPRSIWALGIVSMLMDVSSEMIHGLLPLFLVGPLGMSVFAVGVIEGLAEATALVVKVFSGVLSDRLGRRKGLAVVGYAMSACAKPLFALASGVGLVVAARLVDRVGKGVREAPRDALITDLVAPPARGAAFGLRQSLDTVGAFLGPLLAVALMLLWDNDYRAVFWVAGVPALLCVIVLATAVREPDGLRSSQGTEVLRRDSLRRLGASYGWVVAIGGLVALARFSEAFLVLRSQQTGVPAALVPLVMVAMNAVYAACAYPFGWLSDRMRRSTLLAAGLAVLAIADGVLAFSQHGSALMAGVVLWGVHLGMTQGLLAAMVADAAPAELRGTAFGLFNLVSGGALLAASAVAGLLWDLSGPSATFFTGAAFATLGAIVLLTVRSLLEPADRFPHPPPPPPSPS